MIFFDAEKPHEECGVFGIYNPAGIDAAEDIYYGLTALQHRGQESAGISVFDENEPEGRIITKKGMGLVSEVFSGEHLLNMKGNMGIGHVRYSTTGESSIENAQPIAMNYIDGSLAVVHNGNIVNAPELKRKQMYKGQAHYTTSDSEVIAYEIVSSRADSASMREAVLKTSGQIRGGYAVIVMSPGKLTGIRDPYGIKPLALGRRGNSYALASESSAFTAIGAEFMRDIKPGEIVTITKEGVYSDVSLCQTEHAHCVFEYIYFARTDSVIDGINVHEARINAGRSLAHVSEVSADIVTGVPDSGLAAAEGYAAESGIPFAIAFHKNTYIGRSFIKPTDRERETAVHMKLSVLRDVVQNKRVVLIDDSMVRGTTMKQIIEMMRNAGAKEVHVRISSPPFLYPCCYGTDVTSSKQLIASEHSHSEICGTIGADSLAYLRISDLHRVTGGLSVCTACFDNKYPVTIVQIT